MEALKEAVKEWEQTAAEAVEEKEGASKREKISKFAAVAVAGAFIFSAMV